MFDSLKIFDEASADISAGKMVDVGKSRAIVIVFLVLLFVGTLLGRWSSSNAAQSSVLTNTPPSAAVQGSTSKELSQVRGEFLDFFISTVMNLQYNYFPGHIDGNVVPPNAVALSMAGKRRLDNFALSVATVIQERIDGHIIETGAWKGGASFVAAKVVELLQESHQRKIFVCDSFKGIPKPPSDRTYNTEDHNANFPVFSEVSAARVKVDAAHFGLNVKNIEVVEGYFNETLPVLVRSVPDFKISVLRLDGDTYFSTMDALRVLYPRLARGGIVIVDDFIDWSGCREAVDDFRRQHGILDPIVLAPHSEGEILRGVYWRKGSAENSSTGLRGDANTAYKYPLCLGSSTEHVPHHTHITATPTTTNTVLKPTTALTPTRLSAVPESGPAGLVYDPKVFSGRKDLKMCL